MKWGLIFVTAPLDITADLFLVSVFAGSFLFCCQSSRLVQVLVAHFTLKPLQVHKHLTEMFPVKLEERRKVAEKGENGVNDWNSY